MAAADVRDMLDLPADGQPRPAKKQKIVEKRPEGITRELFALLGERAPPIALNENKYKGRRRWVSKLKVRPWETAPFKNSARSDDLVLHHWQRKRTANEPPTAGGPGEEPNKEHEGKPTVDNIEDSTFAKYNVRAKLPRRYTAEEYDRLLKSDIWSREETDYLMDIVEEYDLRWIVIADRYEYLHDTPTTDPGTKPSTDIAALGGKRRTLEEMKSRYYNVAAHMLAIERPLSDMSVAEFETHEKMMKFNPERERMRKELANTQLNRSKEEVNEEALLLEELKRIVANEKQFIEERKELYARLEAPVSTGNTSIYQTSQGLSQLLQSLLQADKNKKRRPLLGLETSLSSPGSGAQVSARESRPETPAPSTAGTTNQAATKKSGAAAAAQQPTIKHLSPAEEAKYGVSHHDRLSSGVQFRNDKAHKLTQAKSNIQSQKLNAALTELEIPQRLFMPTEKVCKEFEKLIHSVHLLLDVRKFAEKVEGEIRVLEASREDKLLKEKDADGKTEGADADGDQSKKGDANAFPKPTRINDSKPEGKPGENEEATAKANRAGPGGEGANISPTKASSGLHKRSASVLSVASDKSTKRQKK